ncbi:collagen alpha-1(xii) chain [Plakobranchus ocellatus]|uniref:Collagen alpha-1(Xii) chain n=1 Tax=Plakobranchus ocellatus TaxID=259542 RepID=A0AAV3ZYH1_9GAST|nr:collagen alpha-1(xii) chain [Plakobranchus ocellatus]
MTKEEAINEEKEEENGDMEEKSNEVKVEYHLDEYYTKQELIDTTARIPFYGGAAARTRSEIRQGLHTVRQEVFTESHGYRNDAARVVIVITEETWEEYEEIKEEAYALTTDGVNLFTIGVGQGVDYAQLRGISSSPYDQHVFEVDSYSTIGAIKETLVQRTCSC